MYGCNIQNIAAGVFTSGFAGLLATTINYVVKENMRSRIEGIVLGLDLLNLKSCLTTCQENREQGKLNCYACLNSPSLHSQLKENLIGQIEADAMEAHDQFIMTAIAVTVFTCAFVGGIKVYTVCRNN